MPARCIAHASAASRSWMLHEEPGAYVLGRSPDAELFVDDDRISRRHARFSFRAGSWRVEDLGSKNGLVVDGEERPRSVLGGRHWIDVGGVLVRFEVVDEGTARRFAEEASARWRTSRALQRELTADLGTAPLLARLLRSALTLTGLERGFVLSARRGAATDLEVVATENLSLEDLAAPDFRGSVGAVERCLVERRPVTTTDASLDTWLGGRASILGGGIRGLVSLPLIGDGEVLGALYADSRRPGDVVTELDVEILEALADHAALVLSLAAAREALERLELVATTAGVDGAPTPPAGAEETSWRRFVGVETAT